MYLRFITEFTNYWDERETGIFQALSQTLYREDIFEHDYARLRELHKWFNKNLNKPDRFNKHSNKNKPTSGLSWFKDSADEHLKHMFELKPILENYDVIVDVLRSDNPGYIVFEDQFQIVAIPHGKEKNKVS